MGSFWASHVYYLTFVKFDYGYNMKIAVGLGIMSTTCWVIWFLRHRRQKQFAWKVLVATCGPYLVLPLELLDFPPIGGLLDAHACWHLGTVPMSFMYCSLLNDLLTDEDERASKVA